MTNYLLLPLPPHPPPAPKRLSLCAGGICLASELHGGRGRFAWGKSHWGETGAVGTAEDRQRGEFNAHSRWGDTDDPIYPLEEIQVSVQIQKSVTPGAKRNCRQYLELQSVIREIIESSLLKEKGKLMLENFRPRSLTIHLRSFLGAALNRLEHSRKRVKWLWSCAEIIQEPITAKKPFQVCFI